jgi:hypothetical protein
MRVQREGAAGDSIDRLFGIEESLESAIGSKR